MHLTREALLALAESPGMQADPHLASCAQCREDLAALASTMARVTADEIPEPSPLFWEHFSRRVRLAIDGEPAPARARFTGWRSWAYGLGGGLATVLVLVALWPGRMPGSVLPSVPTVSDSALAGYGAAMALPADEEWELVVDVANADPVQGESLDEFLAPVGAEIAVQDLSGDERRALVSLLRDELEGRGPAITVRKP